MGRPRMFDEDKAVEAACRVFWTKGYDGATSEDLCEATGLGRSSVYNTFKSKSHLFHRSLEFYVDRMTSRQVAILGEAEVSPLERVRKLLAVIIDGEMESRRSGYGSGCFTVNTITSFSTKDPRVAEILDRDLERRLLSLRAVVQEGKLDGSIRSPRDTGDLAWYLVGVIYGMRVAAQSGVGESVLRSIAETSETALTC